MDERIVAHVDMDCFYVAVERGIDPSLQSVPCAVAQYNPFGDTSTVPWRENRRANSSDGSLIAVSYEARRAGVKRNMRGSEARRLCPHLQIVQASSSMRLRIRITIKGSSQVPTAHGKADLTVYRTAGARVVSILSVGGVVCERASIDEVYLDVTELARNKMASADFMTEVLPQARTMRLALETSGEANLATSGDASHDTLIKWLDRPGHMWDAHERLLVAGAVGVQHLRLAVTEQLGYTCSAGVSYNKILAKLGSGWHKPNGQTLVPRTFALQLLNSLPIRRVRSLGGKLGERLSSELDVKVVADLQKIPQRVLKEKFGETSAQFLAKIAIGEDPSAVCARSIPQSLSCGKTFRGALAVTSLEQVNHWYGELCGELFERMSVDTQKYKRWPRLISVGADVSELGSGSGPNDSSFSSRDHGSRSGPIHMACSLQTLKETAVSLFKKLVSGKRKWSASSLFVTVSNFEPVDTSPSITSFLVSSCKPTATATASEQSCKNKTPSNDDRAHSPDIPKQRGPLISTMSTSHGALYSEITSTDDEPCCASVSSHAQPPTPPSTPRLSCSAVTTVPNTQENAPCLLAPNQHDQATVREEARNEISVRVSLQQLCRNRGLDVEVFTALPPDLQQEIITSHPSPAGILQRRNPTPKSKRKRTTTSDGGKRSCAGGIERFLQHQP